MVSRRQLIKISALGTASFAAPAAYSVSEMTMSYNTGNALGSTDPRDLSDNAKIFDSFANGPAAHYKDRFGVERKSIPGMIAEFDSAQAQRGTAFQGEQHDRDSAFDVAQSTRANEFATFLSSSGFETPADYAPGLSITRPTQTIRYLNELYRAKVASLPFVTSTWDADSPRLLAVGDASLRQELADDTDPEKGAGVSAMSAELDYPEGTVGKYLGIHIRKDYAYVTPSLMDRRAGTGNDDIDTAAIRAAFATGEDVAFNLPLEYVVFADTSPITGGPYQSYCLQTARAGQTMTFLVPATIKQAPGSNAVLFFVGHDDVQIDNVGGGVFDGNRSQNVDHATANDVIRGSGIKGLRTSRLIIRNFASAGLKLDDCDDSYHYRPDVRVGARNGIYVNGSRNKLISPTVIDTEDGQYANGIFFTASASSVSTTRFIYDNECLNAYVERAGDIGIESGIHCVNTHIRGGTIKDSYNAGCIVRDSSKFQIKDLRIQVRSGGNIQTGLIVDSQLYKLNPTDPNAILDAFGGKLSGIVVSNVGPDGSGFEIEQGGVHLNDLYAEGRGKTAGGSAFNIKSSNVRGYALSSRNITNHIRIAGSQALTGVKLTGGDFRSVASIVRVEQAITDSTISGHTGTDSSSPLALIGAGDVKGLRFFGNEDYQNPKRVFTGNGLISNDTGFVIEGLATVNSYFAISANLQAGMWSIRTNTGEAALFMCDKSGLITMIVESASIGASTTTKAYRIVVSDGLVSIKRHEVVKTIDYFVFSRVS
ncbi:hypothetical protein D9M71_224070 [compost metagenome]